MLKTSLPNDCMYYIHGYFTSSYELAYEIYMQNKTKSIQYVYLPDYQFFRRWLDLENYKKKHQSSLSNLMLLKLRLDKDFETYRKLDEKMKGNKNV